MLILVGCLCDWSLETFCFSTCLIFIVFSRALSAVQYENCTILPLGPLDADPDHWKPGYPDEDDYIFINIFVKQYDSLTNHFLCYIY